MASLRSIRMLCPLALALTCFIATAAPAARPAPSRAVVADPDAPEPGAPRSEPFEDLHVTLTPKEQGKKVNVAVFFDPKAAPENGASIMAKIANNIPGYHAEIVTSATFSALDLSKTDILIFPGGSGSGQARALGDANIDRIRDFAKNGGGVLGICAGAYLVSDSTKKTRSLELLNAKVFDRANWNRGPSTTVTVALLPPGAASATTAPATLRDDGVAVLPQGSYDPANSYTMRYHQGPALTPDHREGLPDYVPLARFLTDVSKPNAPKGMLASRDAIVASFYGKGKVVAVSPHPESHQKYRMWYVNALRWLADRDDHEKPTTDRVLFGKR